MGLISRPNFNTHESLSFFFFFFLVEWKFEFKSVEFTVHVIMPQENILPANINMGPAKVSKSRIPTNGNKRPLIYNTSF